LKLAQVRYANALLMWNEAVKNVATDTGLVRKTSKTYKLMIEAKKTMDDQILKEAGIKRFYGRSDD